MHHQFLLLTLMPALSGQAERFKIGTTQSVAVKGKLLCNGEPAAKVKVKLYDIDG